MAYVIKKGSKYLEGHSYATGRGYSFSWTPNIEKAQRFADDDPSPDVFSARTKGKIMRVENTRKELRELGKRRMREMETIRPVAALNAKGEQE